MYANITLQVPAPVADGKYTAVDVTLNGFWVDARIGAVTMYRRHGNEGPWLDASHQPIACAIHALEVALKAAIAPTLCP